MKKWIDIKDELPTQCEDVLTFSVIPDEEIYEDYSPIYVGFYENGTFYSTYDYYESYNYISLGYVTHWMPLPEPPKESDSE